MEVKIYTSTKNAVSAFIASVGIREIDEIIFFETWNGKQCTNPGKKGKEKKEQFPKFNISSFL